MRKGVEQGIIEFYSPGFFLFLPGLFFHLPDPVGEHGIDRCNDKVHSKEKSVFSCTDMKRILRFDKEKIPDQGTQGGG